MKRRLLFVCTILSLATISQAQIKKGSVLLGGSIGTLKNKSESNGVETKSSSIYVGPSIGFVVKDNWVLGINASYSTYDFNQGASNYGNDGNGYSIGAFGRKYMPLSSHFYLYGQGNLNYNREKSKQFTGTDNVTNMESKGFNLGVTPGLTYAVSKRFHLEAFLNNLINLNYTNSENKTSSLSGINTIKAKNFSFQTNLSSSIPLNVGFRFVLGK
jgi:hypothetical protein